MLQSYNRIRFSLSAVNHMKIKSLIRNHTITKCFLFDEKAFLILALYSVAPFYFSTLCFCVFKGMVETYSIYNWFYKSFMVLNPDKCSIMLFGVKDELQRGLVSNNVTIKNSKEEKLLGINFDNTINFSTHLTSITKKANVKLNPLTRVQKYMTPEWKTFFTSSFIKSHFNCCPLIWMFCSKKAPHRLNNIHERSLCLMHQDHVSNFITLLVNANEKLIHQIFGVNEA